MARLYCRRCRIKIDGDSASCPKCGEVLVEVDPQWQESRIEREVEGVKDRTTMYIILAIVVATVGMLEGGLLLISASLLGLFGIVLVCLGIGYPATAHRYERKAVSLQKQLNR